MRILFVADIFGRPGRRAAAECIPQLIRERQVDFCIANGENAAGGFGITENLAGKLHSYGVDVITSGNHIWDRKDFMSYLSRDERVLRPFNYPSSAPGKGAIVQPSRAQVPVAVINLQGRTNMATTDCPFRLGRAAVKRLKEETPIVFVDFHAEATAEKIALGRHLDGLASAVIGTHTHVQTADECILPKGTAFLTDAGMTGPHDSVIGVRSDLAIQRFISQVPVRFKPAEDNVKFCGALIDLDQGTGQALHIERLQIDLQFEEPGDVGDED